MKLLLTAGLFVLVVGIAAKDVALKGVASKGVASKGVASKDVAPKGVASKDVAPKDDAPKDVAPKDVAPKDVAPKDVASEFKAAKIEPEIIDKVPNEIIEIKYGDKEIKLGTEITPTEAKDIPEVHYKHEGGILYTLVMTDPDVPVRGYNREWQHWVVGNIPEDKVAKGEVLTEYVGPAPPKNTNLHRYVFLLYKQNQGSITFDERRIGNRDKRRTRFSVKKFAEKYNLEGPIAGNFMKAKFDDYVPVIQKQIGIYL